MDVIKKQVVAIVALLWGISGTTFAATVHVDIYNPEPNILLSGSSSCGSCGGVASLDWIFDITTDGYDPVVEDVISATIELNLTDDTGGHHTMTRSMDGNEYAQLEAGGDILDNWEVDTGSISFAVLSLLTLNEFGTLDVTLTATTGDFYFDDATLTANTVVPLPAAIWLFGSGLLGLLGVARRRRM